MSFLDMYLPARLLSENAMGAPRWSTTITQSDSGAEQRNQNWVHPMHEYTLPEAVRSPEQYESLKEHWMVTRGPFYSFSWRDPLDFASTRLTRPGKTPPIAMTDQEIGTGDGATTQFQLVKTYTRGTGSYSRRIWLPVVATVVVAVGGVAVADLEDPLTFTVSRPGGVVTLSAAPDAGKTVTAGFLFDVQVRFAEDTTLQGVIRNFNATGFSEISLTEVREEE